MTRALVRLRRTDTSAPWSVASVFIATSDQLEGLAPRGSEARDVALAQDLAHARLLIASEVPDTPKTYEEWIDWALDRYANGHSTWAVEVEPASRIDELLTRVLKENDGAREDVGLEVVGPTIPPPGTPGSVELIETLEGFILRLDRETDERLYGSVMATDGEPVGLYDYQISIPKDRVITRTPLSEAPGTYLGPGGSQLSFKGRHQWRLAAPPLAPGPPDDVVLDQYRVPTQAWPDAPGHYRDLRVFRDRIAGALMGCAIGDRLGLQVDGLSKSGVLTKMGSVGVRDMATESHAGSDATAVGLEMARCLVDAGGRFDLKKYETRLLAITLYGSGGGPSLAPFIGRVRTGMAWYDAAKDLRASDYGAAVRTGPIGLVHAAERSASSLLREAVRSAIFTHRDRVGIAGAVAMAAAIGYLVRLSSTGVTSLEPRAFLDFVATSISELEDAPSPTRRPPSRQIYLRDRIRRIEGWLEREPGAVFRRTWTGAPAMESVPAALYCFLRTSDRADDSLIAAANATHETAAIGAMTGTLTGAWVGAERLNQDVEPWWREIQARDGILGIADQLVDRALDLADEEPPPLTFLA